MIKKVTDKINLSGVSSPLLPLIYCDFKFSAVETDGVYFQYDEQENLQSLFSLKNGCVTLVKVGDIDVLELSAFFDLLGVCEILSDCEFSSDSSKLALMNRNTQNDECSDVLFIDKASKTRDYLEIFNLLSENEGDFSHWYSNFSKKINSSYALGAYKTNDKNVVSTAIANAVFDNKATISGVFTNPLYRGKGYASECIKALVNKLFELDVKEVYLWCEEDKIPFYVKNGFDVCGSIYIRKV